MDAGLRSLTYVSRPTEPLDDTAVAALALEAARLNALDGITGVLVYNGLRFFQTVEGVAEAIDDLLDRLKRDLRHCDLVVCNTAPIERRSFGSWNMHLVMLDERNGDVQNAQIRAHVACADPDGLFWRR